MATKLTPAQIKLISKVLVGVKKFETRKKVRRGSCFAGKDCKGQRIASTLISKSMCKWLGGKSWKSGVGCTNL